MTLTDLITGLREKQPGKHRADTIAELREENAQLLTWQAQAESYFDRLIDDRNDTYAAWQRAENGRQQAEIVVIDQASQIRDQQRQIAELTRRLEIGVLAEAAATRTQEIDVRDLQRRFETGPVLRLGASPLAVTNPGRGTPSWAIRDDEPEPVT